MKTSLLLTLLLLSVAAGHRLAAAFNEDAPVFTRLSGTVIVPAELANQSLYVAVRINGRGPFRMLVDTGASFSLVTPAVVAAVEARDMPADAGSEESINAFGEYADMSRVRLRTVEIGGVQFEGVMAGVAGDLGVFGQVDGKPIDGLLGFSVFSDLVLGLDFPGQRLLMSANWPAGLPPIRAELAVKSICSSTPAPITAWGCRRNSHA